MREGVVARQKRHIAVTAKIERCRLVVTVKKAKRAKKYQYQVAYAKDFSWVPKSITTKSRTAVFKNMDRDEHYFIRVRAINGDKRGKWSVAKSKHTRLAVPYIQTVDFTDRAVRALQMGATQYRFQFSETASFAKVLKIVKRNNIAAVSLPEFAAGTTYYVRCKSEGLSDKRDS